MRFGRGTTGSMALHFLTAPLLRRGSSCAVGNCRRPGVPPLRGIRKVSFFVRAGHRPSHVPGDRKGRPYEEKRTGSVGSVNSGAVVKSQSPQFLQTQGPVARREFRQATQILRAGNFSRVYRRTSPVMGSGESGPMGTKCPTAASPAAFWVISLVPPGEAQRSGFAGKRRSKGTSAVFATRRKRSRVDFATTSRRGQSKSPPAGGETPPSTL